MDDHRRLVIALTHMMRANTPDKLKATCNDEIDLLHQTLPKEQGGLKVVMEGRASGRSVPRVGRATKVAAASMSVHKGK